MPHPDTRSSKTHSSLTPYFLVLIFIGPLIAATLLYAYRDSLHFKTLNTGKLLSPPINTQPLPFFNKALLGKWQFIYVRGKECNKDCQIMISALHTIHAALGKARTRVHTRIITKAEKEAGTPELAEGSIAIIDPNGWIIMHYPTNTDPKGILRDMRRLLRISHG